MSIQSIHHVLGIKILFLNIIKEIRSLTHYYQSAMYITISWHKCHTSWLKCLCFSKELIPYIFRV